LGKSTGFRNFAGLVMAHGPTLICPPAVNRSSIPPLGDFPRGLQHGVVRQLFRLLSSFAGWVIRPTVHFIPVKERANGTEGHPEAED
jgi:hypothetical protein